MKKSVEIIIHLTCGQTDLFYSCFYTYNEKATTTNREKTIMEIKVKKLDPEAKLPTYANPSDAGMDLFSIEDITINPGELHKVKTGISIELPDGYVSLIWDKSGIASKSIKTFAGVIDSGYRGEYMIALMNLGKQEYKIEKGDKIAQVLIQKVEHPDVLVAEELSKTSRGAGGFGSSGIR